MANLDVSYQDLQDVAGKLKSGQHDAEVLMDGLRKLVRNLVDTGFKTDKASVQFDLSYDEFNEGVKKTLGGLEGMAGYLTTAAETLADVDDKLAKGLK
ncbi:WXG100 family type VII secretion target [Galbitalea sp. SE-J8]|uniref:WXG100 family type VII secretion target n=1 Tax=Galbitalea sp. SE-J8 TaxID=3054952 RepID=UPI00259C8557|nr:WXG100 family type VII secretion target [Galbitalea sp. SE-J8]MDM4762678.1 WXG100 family type VII secretion target [Galbitalea sp. SE-J8]